MRKEGDEDCSYLVDRGGGWACSIAYSKIERRVRFGPGDVDDDLGFRLVRRRSALERLVGDSPQESEEQPEVRR